MSVSISPLKEPLKGNLELCWGAWYKDGGPPKFGPHPRTVPKTHVKEGGWKWALASDDDPVH